MPRLGSSIDAGCRPISFGANLNFDLPKPRTFPGLTASGDARSCRQDLVRQSHGVRAMDQLRAHRAAPWRQRRRALVDVCRAVSSDGVRAADMARELARCRGQSLCQFNQVTRDGISLGSQTFDAGRRERIARLAYLIGPRGRIDPPGLNSMRCRAGAGRPTLRTLFTTCTGKD